MAAPRIIEHDSGIWSGQIHPHNGYYSGNHSVRRQSQREADERLRRWATEMTAPGRDTTDLDTQALRSWAA